MYSQTHPYFFSSFQALVTIKGDTGVLYFHLHQLCHLRDVDVCGMSGMKHLRQWTMHPVRYCPSEGLNMGPFTVTPSN